MSENETCLLVEKALKTRKEPYSEDITDEVFGVIEESCGLKKEYDKIAGEFSGGNKGLNQNIGYFVKKVTERTTKSTGNRCKRNTLAKTYSKLVNEAPGE